MLRMMSRFLQFSGSTITYKRGAACWPVKMHKRPQQPQMVADGDGQWVSMMITDFLTDPQGEEFGEIGEPKSGDIIESRGERYTVLPGASGKTYRKMADHLIRIHTKRTR